MSYSVLHGALMLGLDATASRVPETILCPTWAASPLWGAQQSPIWSSLCQASSRLWEGEPGTEGSGPWVGWSEGVVDLVRTSGLSLICDILISKLPRQFGSLFGLGKPQRLPGRGVLYLFIYSLFSSSPQRTPVHSCVFFLSF